MQGSHKELCAGSHGFRNQFLSQTHNTDPNCEHVLAESESDRPLFRTSRAQTVGLALTAIRVSSDCCSKCHRNACTPGKAFSLEHCNPAGLQCQDLFNLSQTPRLQQMRQQEHCLVAKHGTASERSAALLQTRQRIPLSRATSESFAVKAGTDHLAQERPNVMHVVR